MGDAPKEGGPPDAGTPDSGAQDAGAPGGGAPELSPFQLLLGGLAAQIQVALGFMPDPTGNETKVDLPAARQGIDMLSALESRTKGNLEPGEQAFLDTILTQLRMAYVEIAKREE